MRRWILRLLLILAIASAFLYFVWPTPWTYTAIIEDNDKVLFVVRKNRISGTLEVRVGNLWARPHSADEPLTR